MNTYGKDTLAVRAKEVFAANPQAQKVACTVDGCCFITDESDRFVQNHAQHNRYGKELAIHNFSREGLMIGVNTLGTSLNSGETIPSKPRPKSSKKAKVAKADSKKATKTPAGDPNPSSDETVQNPESPKTE